MTHETDEHEMIYLEPACCAEPDEGRRWCQDADVFDCDEGVAPTRFIRADLVEQLEAQLAESDHSLDCMTTCAGELQDELSMTKSTALDASKAEAQLASMIEGLELQNDAINGTPEALKTACQIVTLAAKKYDPMKAQLAAVRDLDRHRIAGTKSTEHRGYWVDSDELEAQLESRDVVSPEYLQSWIDRAQDTDSKLDAVRVLVKQNHCEAEWCGKSFYKGKAGLCFYCETEEAIGESHD